VDLPSFCESAVKKPQKPIDFYAVLFGSAKYKRGMTTKNSLDYPMSLLKTSSATQLLLRPKPGQP
jgi:hypothetical protein